MMGSSQLQRFTALFLLGMLAWVTLPPSLWHSHTSTTGVETYQCEHDAHLNHEDEDCLICDWQATQIFLPASATSSVSFAALKAFRALSSAPLILFTAYLPFQRGPPLFIQS